MNPLNIPNKFLNNFTALTRIINRFTGISQPLSCFPLAGWLPTVLIISSVRTNISGEDALRRPVRKKPYFGFLRTAASRRQRERIFDEIFI